MIITNINQKGGVGKTTNTIHIGSYLAMLGKKVLLVDADPQCDLSAGIGVYESSFTLLNFLGGSIDSITKNLQFEQRADNMFLLPGHEDFDSNDYDRFKLKERLTHPKLNIYNYFDYIFIDVPPEGIKKNSVSPSELALCASDVFITTIKPDLFSVKNLDKFLAKVFILKEKHNPKLTFAGICISDVLENKTIFKKYHNLLKEKSGDLLFKTYIRRDAQIEKSADDGETIFQYNPTCRAALDYKNLTEELIKKIENNGKSKNEKTGSEKSGVKL